MLVPWTILWDRNFFAGQWPLLASWMASPFVRGAVTGVGLITAVAGVRELASILTGGRDAVVTQAAPGADRP